MFITQHILSPPPSLWAPALQRQTHSYSVQYFNVFNCVHHNLIVGNGRRNKAKTTKRTDLVSAIYANEIAKYCKTLHYSTHESSTASSEEKYVQFAWMYKCIVYLFVKQATHDGAHPRQQWFKANVGGLRQSTETFASPSWLNLPNLVILHVHQKTT